MIEVKPKTDDNVVRIAAAGQVTAQDYELIIIPAIEAYLKEHDKIRILYQLGPAFIGFSPGAMWDDTKMGFAHLTAWEKIAVVADMEWINSAVSVFKFAIPCPVKVFSNAEVSEAEAWITS